MSLLFETIRLQDGTFQNLEFHTHRLNKSRKEIFGSCDIIYLEKLIRIPETSTKGIVKCKVLYGIQVEEITFEAYTPRAITSLKLIEDNTISYRHKYSDRSHLNSLLSKRGNCDDILIVKNGLITDASFANIILYNGSQWITPAMPLLEGTMRSYLIANRCIYEKDIAVNDLQQYQKARLINALLPLETSHDILLKNIGFKSA